MSYSRTVHKLSAEDARVVENALMRFNSSVVPFTQREPFIHMRYGIHDDSGTLIAGITAVLYCWCILYTDALWVDERHRHRGLGTTLVRGLEDEAQNHGASLCHLDTFDFQAKSFYEKLGYEVFGILDECPPGHRRYFLKKQLIGRSPG
ncbi:MAG: GNAT family N-acetyltransferase [Candidatus Cybelea sp.]